MNEKEKLEALNKSLRDSLGNQLDEGKAQTKVLLKKALVSGAAAVLLYSLFKVITSEEESTSKKKVKSPRVSSDHEPMYLIEAAKKEAIAWSLKFASEQLKKFLDDIKRDEERSIS